MQSSRAGVALMRLFRSPGRLPDVRVLVVLAPWRWMVVRYLEVQYLRPNTLTIQEGKKLE